MKPGRQLRWRQRWDTTLERIGILTSHPESGGGQCQVGSLTGAVAS